MCDYFDNNICILYTLETGLNAVKYHDFYPLLPQKMSIFSSVL